MGVLHVSNSIRKCELESTSTLACIVAGPGFVWIPTTSLFTKRDPATRPRLHNESFVVHWDHGKNHHHHTVYSTHNTLINTALAISVVSTLCFLRVINSNRFATITSVKKIFRYNTPRLSACMGGAKNTHVAIYDQEHYMNVAIASDKRNVVLWHTGTMLRIH